MHVSEEQEQEPVQWLYERLVRALRQARPDPFGGPVTVAEIYQELVPYRVVRGEGGFAMNADYEHALLRLLSGEGGLLTLEPPSAREIILRELESVNPNVTIYRAYAACDAWVQPFPGDDDDAHDPALASAPWLLELADDDIEARPPVAPA
jgi:hypothetical protein